MNADPALLTKRTAAQTSVNSSSSPGLSVRWPSLIGAAERLRMR
jgi:hypothetical protein